MRDGFARQDPEGSGVRTVVDGAAELVTGAQVAWALQRAGCEARLVGPDHVAVFRAGVQIVRLPVDLTIRPSMLRVLARTAGLSPEKLQKLLFETAGQDSH